MVEEEPSVLSVGWTGIDMFIDGDIMYYFIFRGIAIPPHCTERVSVSMSTSSRGTRRRGGELGGGGE